MPVGRHARSQPRSTRSASWSSGCSRPARCSRQPTFFEVTTAVAFELFRRAAVDVAVLEVGLGGRLDATNVLDPVVTAITSIGFDHQHYLGSTLREIAREKAGIIKPGVPVVVGELPAEAMAAVEEIAARAGRGDDPRATAQRRRRTSTERHSALAGAHQKRNAAVAVRMLEAAGCARHQDVSGGDRGAAWPGRMARTPRPAAASGRPRTPSRRGAQPRRRRCAGSVPEERARRGRAKTPARLRRDARQRRSTAMLGGAAAGGRCARRDTGDESAVGGPRRDSPRRQRRSRRHLRLRSNHQSARRLQAAWRALARDRRRRIDLPARRCAERARHCDTLTARYILANPVMKAFLMAGLLERRARRDAARARRRQPPAQQPATVRSDHREASKREALTIHQGQRRDTISGDTQIFADDVEFYIDAEPRASRPATSSSSQGSQPDRGRPRRLQHRDAARHVLQRDGHRHGASRRKQPPRPGRRSRRRRSPARKPSSISSARRSRRSGRRNTGSPTAASRPACSRRRAGICIADTVILNVDHYTC